MAEVATLEDDPDTLVLIEDDEDEGTAPEKDEDSPEEKRIAADMGWKEGFTGPNKRSAKQFIADTREVIRNTNSKNARLESQIARIVGEVAKLSANQRQATDAQHERALADAVESGDLEGAKRILAAAKSAHADDPSPVVSEFKARNAWYGVNSKATDYANSRDLAYTSEAGGKIVNPTAHMKRVEDDVRELFPALFDEPEEKKPEPKPARGAPLVAAGGRVARPSNGELTVAGMTTAMKQAAKEFGVSEESYIRSYNATTKKDAK